MLLFKVKNKNYSSGNFLHFMIYYGKKVLFVT